MFHYWSFASIVGLLGLINLVHGAKVTFVQSGAQLTFGMYSYMNGTGTDLKMQLSAPTSVGWGAVGIGKGMAGALMFMIYPSSNSKDVTLSIRTAPGEVKPHELEGIDYTVSKSYIMDDTMVAEFTCHSCSSWPGGMLDTTSINAPWIYAVGPPNQPVHSDDKNTQSIQQHQKYNDNFYVNMPMAQSGSADMSFTSALPTSNDGASDSQDNTAGMSAASTETGSSQPADYPNLVTAHAFLLGLSFAIFMPLSAIFMRLGLRVSFTMHWVTNTIVSLMIVSGLAIAITFSIQGGEYGDFKKYHQIIGIIAISSILLFQPILGFLQHWRSLRFAKRTILGITHTWIGRVMILLGVLNLIFGLLLSGESSGTIAGVGVVALLVYIATFITTFLLDERNKKRKSSQLSTPNQPMSGAS